MEAKAIMTPIVAVISGGVKFGVNPGKV